MGIQFGPDGRPAHWDGAAWVSHDGLYWWNGAAWLPVGNPGRRARLSLTDAGIVLVLAGLVGYVVYTTASHVSGFTFGYIVGSVVYLAVLAVVFNYAGRWGCAATPVRIFCLLLALLKVLGLLYLVYVSR